MAASASRARASSSGPSRTVPGPNSAKKRAMAASATLLAAAPSTRVKARIASSPMSAAPCSKAAMNDPRSAGTSVSVLGRDARGQQGAHDARGGRPVRAATSVTVIMVGAALGHEVARHAGQRSHAVGLDHLLDGGAVFGQVLQEGQPFVRARRRAGRRGRPRARRPSDPPAHSVQASVADDCGRAIPLSCVSR